jgi:hypothetical protein
VLSLIQIGHRSRVEQLLPALSAKELGWWEVYTTHIRARQEQSKGRFLFSDTVTVVSDTDRVSGKLKLRPTYSAHTIALSCITDSISVFRFTKRECLLLCCIAEFETSYELFYIRTVTQGDVNSSLQSDFCIYC